MSIIEKIHRPGELTGMVVSTATRAPGPESVYLGFRTADDQQENVEISVEEAIALHGWLDKLMARIQEKRIRPGSS